MYSFLYYVYFVLKRLEKRLTFISSNRCLKMVRWIVGYVEAYYNLFVTKLYEIYPSQKFMLNTSLRNERIIVSLTSFPKRIGTLWLTIESLMRQTVKPDEIILWLAEEQFDGIDSLPKELLNLQKCGLTIRFCDDLRSHKKYYYVLQEYSNDLVILADDDMFYPYDTISKLMGMHKKYPNDICTMTAQLMPEDMKIKPSEWRNPKLDEDIEHSSRLQIFTGSGSLYPPQSLDSNVFDKELIKSLCPYADDLWLTYMALKKGTKITMEIPWRAFPITIYGTSQDSLWYINAAEGKNDEQWQSLIRHFGEL